MSISEAHLAKAINESGFPLQLGLKQLAQSQPDRRVILTEHPWLGPLGDHEKVVDMVIGGRGNGPQRLVIECKRARNTEWLFLREQIGHEPRDGRLAVRARTDGQPNGPRGDCRIEPRTSPRTYWQPSRLAPGDAARR